MQEREEPTIPTVPDQPPPQFELEQPDDYSQYLLHSRSEILAVLRSLVQKGALITVYFDQGRSFLLTSMLTVNADTPRRIEFVILQTANSLPVALHPTSR